MLDFVAFFLIGMIIYRFLRFISTPIFKMFGFYRYYSPLFFTMPWFGGMRDIHMGTSWDFIRLRTKNSRVMLMQLSAGLLQLIKEIENGKIDPNVKFRGNSHFLNEATLRKLGFVFRNPNPIENFLFFLTYMEDCFLRSLSAGKILLIPSRNNKIIYFTAEDLIEKKSRIEAIYLRLAEKKSKSANRVLKNNTTKELTNVA